MNEAHGHDEASGVKRRRYVPDCGTSTHKFLSYAAAIQTRKFYRPGRESAGERRSYAVCEDFGAHQPRCLQRCGLVLETSAGTRRATLAGTLVHFADAL